MKSTTHVKRGDLMIGTHTVYLALNHFSVISKEGFPKSVKPLAQSYLVHINRINRRTESNIVEVVVDKKQYDAYMEIPS